MLAERLKNGHTGEHFKSLEEITWVWDMACSERCSQCNHKNCVRSCPTQLKARFTALVCYPRNWEAKPEEQGFSNWPLHVSMILYLKNRGVKKLE